MAVDGFLGFECDTLVRWFSQVYPQHKMTVHYKWKTPNHHYYFEIEGAEGNTLLLPLIVPDAWFEDPEMEATLREHAVERLQKKTIEALG